MQVDLFDFDLPRELIADRPAVPRHAARLLDVGDKLADRYALELPDLLRPGDMIVYNDTRVIPARLTGLRHTAKVEFTLHREIAPDQWLAFARPAKKLRQGDRIQFSGGLEGEIAEKREGGEVAVRFSLAGPALLALLELFGSLPLPPYIKRAEGADARDRDDYQTLFARAPGAVAAPTAGLHFTPDLVAALKARGIEMTALTLHVGAGTFLPVKTETAEDHVMHHENGILSASAATAINRARAGGGRIVAIGTTVLRLLESIADENGNLAPFNGDTDIFILPGYRFKIVDMLLTNFHLPRSTLFMLVCAFAGMDRMRAAYAHGIAAGYRFYSYGDCSLLRRETGP